MDLSIITISYNTKEPILRCIESVFKETTNIDFEMIVVDNHSQDDSVNAIREQYPKVKVIASEKNLGFGKACNLAAQQAQGEYVCMLNPDTVVLKQALNKLLAFARSKPEGGLFGGKTLNDDLSLNPTSVWAPPSLWTFFCDMLALPTLFKSSSLLNPEGMGGWHRDSLRSVEVITGCCLLCQKSFFEELGGFDERFFMYSKDTDLSKRSLLKGRRNWFCPESEVIHIGGASEKVKADKMIRLFKGKVLYADKHWSSLGSLLVRKLIVTRVLIRIFGYTLKSLIKKSSPSSAWLEIFKRRREWLRPS